MNSPSSVIAIDYEFSNLSCFQYLLLSPHVRHFACCSLIQRSYKVSDDEDYFDEDLNEILDGKSTNYMESHDEDVVESDIELEREIVDPYNDSPQKVPLHF